MSLDVLLAIVRDEAGADAAARIERRLISEMAGARVRIRARVRLHDEMIPSGVTKTEAARQLGVHRSTVYRLIR